MVTEHGSPLVGVMLHPVRGQLAFEMCVEQLGSAIRLGIFRPGDRLPSERDLAALMDVSRATLREAISALRAAGFVTTRRGRGGGTVVMPRDGIAAAGLPETSDLDRELREVIVLRSVLEPGAAEAAAIRDLPAADRDLIAECLGEVEAAADPEQYRQADARLHLAIATVSGSEELSRLCGEVQIRVHQLLMRIPFLHPNIQHSDDQHRQMVAAILAGDPETARRVMRDHCAATASLLNGLVPRTESKDRS